MNRQDCINSKIPWLVARLTAVVIALSLLPIHGMAMQKTSDDCRQSIWSHKDFPSSENPIVVSIKELQDSPEDFYGKTVTIDGELHRDFTDNVFTVAGGDGDILIISTVTKGDAVVPLQHSLRPGKSVRITGVVAPYDRGLLECAYGPLNLEGREGRSFTRMPVLIVDKAPPKPSAAPFPEKPDPLTTQPKLPEVDIEIPELPAPQPPPKPWKGLPRTAGEPPLLLSAGLVTLDGGLVKSRPS